MQVLLRSAAIAMLQHTKEEEHAVSLAESLAKYHWEKTACKDSVTCNLWLDWYKLHWSKNTEGSDFMHTQVATTDADGPCKSKT